MFICRQEDAFSECCIDSFGQRPSQNLQDALGGVVDCVGQGWLCLAGKSWWSMIMLLFVRLMHKPSWSAFYKWWVFHGVFHWNADVWAPPPQTKENQNKTKQNIKSNIKVKFVSLVQPVQNCLTFFNDWNVIFFFKQYKTWGISTFFFFFLFNQLFPKL